MNILIFMATTKVSIDMLHISKQTLVFEGIESYHQNRPFRTHVEIYYLGG